MPAMPGGTRRDAVRLAQACAIVFTSVLLVPPIGQMVAALAVAALAARGRFRACGIVLLAAAIAAFIWTRSLELPLAVVATGATGLPIGIGIGLRWPFGRIVVVSTAFAFAVNLVLTLSQLDALRAQAAELETLLTTSLEGPDAEEFREAGYERILEYYRYFEMRWQYLFFGLNFSGTLTSVCVLAAVASRWTHRRTGLPEGAGSFSAMRPPEWLVWAVIAAAGVWFIDYRWPSEALRFVSWNTAIGLLWVYWLNGLGILIYGFAAWKPHPLVLFALLMVLIWAGMVSLFPMLGLFDIWFDFRKRIDRLVASRGDPQQTPDDTA